MKVIDTRNVNTAIAQAIPYILAEGVEETSRNGRVIVAPGPVMTIYNQPQERVLFGPTRDANPFFHLFESLWMLGGHNDLAFPAQFNKRFKEYSDNGEAVWGAYGWRWREFFGYDQLKELVQELKNNPTSRRCVLSMWNGMDVEGTKNNDLYIARNGGKDVPCNTHAYFEVRQGKLNMTVCCRSNDILWGCYGANAVHFSMLLEYMAEQIGVPMGVYRQFSNNFHAYLSIYDREKLKLIGQETSRLNLYNVYPSMKTVPLASNEGAWEKELTNFLDKGEVNYGRPSFFTQVAGPMYDAWFARKAGMLETAFDQLSKMPDCDWRRASVEWMRRRQKERTSAA